MKATEFVVCPSCTGTKTVNALVNYGSPKGCVWEMVPCIRCKGAGVLSKEEVSAIENGERMREERKARGESTRDAARRLGMDWREYNDLEWGRVR